MAVVQAHSDAEACAEIRRRRRPVRLPDAALLQAARKLRWAQSPTASMEKYLYPELVHSPVVVTNMRGIFSDVIADHVFGFILCFAKNFHIYIRQQAQASGKPLAAKQNELPGYGGPGEVHPSDGAAMTLGDCTLGVIGLGGIGRRPPAAVWLSACASWRVDPKVSDTTAGRHLHATRTPRRRFGQSDFVVIAAPHTPETFKLFNRARIRQDEEDRPI